jgi:hypothetical protein
MGLVLEQGRGIKRSEQHEAAVQRVFSFFLYKDSLLWRQQAGRQAATPRHHRHKCFGRPARKGSGELATWCRRCLQQ